MSEAWIGVIGVVIGIVLTEIFTLFRNHVLIKSNEKIANKNFELEMKKIQREFDLEQLNYLLKPIIFIYMESDQLHDYLLTEDRETFGKGLYVNHADKVNDIMGKNRNLVSLEMQKQYLIANHPDIGLDFADNFYRQLQREYLISEERTELKSIEDFSFDDDRKFINLVKKTANEIEKKYK